MDDAATKKRAVNEARRRKRKSRGRGIRRTTGCITCKRRHLRCDEASPECGQCVKSKQTCLYVTPQPQTPLSIYGDNDNDNDNNDNNLDEEEEGNDPCDQTDLQTSQVPSLSSVVESIHVSELISPSIPITDQLCIASNSSASLHPAPTPPDAAFYRWFGLLADDVAVTDEDTSVWVTPAAAALSNSHPPPLLKGLSLETFRERYAIPGVVVPCLSEPLPTEATSPSSWHGSQPAQLCHEELRLFDNFVAHVSSWIDLHDPARCFSVFVPHLAVHDAGLMTAILALSSRQLSVQPDASASDRDRRIGVQYYYDTLRYLQRAMSVNAYTTSLELLATALIVSMYEMLDDTGSGWERHLKGVFWIQRSQLIQGETGGLKSAVWWAWLRQDVWAAFRERRKTLSFWKPTKTYAAMTPYEMAARVVWIFAKAVDYCSDEETTAGEDKVRMRLERADTILHMLSEWKENLPVEFTPLPSVKKTGPADFLDPLCIHPPAFGVSMQLYYSAQILLMLHKPSLGGLRGYAEQQKCMVTAASMICRIAMTCTDSASSLMSSQCLYIAGLTMQDSERRNMVVRLIDSCHQRTGWPSQSLSGNLNEEWAKLDSL